VCRKVYKKVEKCWFRQSIKSSLLNLSYNWCMQFFFQRLDFLKSSWDWIRQRVKDWKLGAVGYTSIWSVESLGWAMKYVFPDSLNFTSFALYKWKNLKLVLSRYSKCSCAKKNLSQGLVYQLRHLNVSTNNKVVKHEK